MHPVTRGSRADATSAPDDHLPMAFIEAGSTLAVAESLTGGLLSSRFARMEDASEWFRGGIVAYSRTVKERLLDIGTAPVVSEPAVRSMADVVAQRLGTTHAVAVTGVGGPDDQDGVPAGTVWIAIHSPAGTKAERHHFDGPPAKICEQTCDAATALVARSITDRVAPGDGRGP